MARNEGEHLDHILSSTTRPTQAQTTSSEATSTAANPASSISPIHSHDSTSPVQRAARVTRSKHRQIGTDTDPSSTSPDTTQATITPGSTGRKRRSARFSLPEASQSEEHRPSVTKKRKISPTSPEGPSVSTSTSVKGKKRATRSPTPPLSAPESSSSRTVKRSRSSVPGTSGTRYSLRKKTSSSSEDHAAHRGKVKGKGKGKAARVGAAQMPKKANPRQKRGGPSTSSAEGMNTRKGSASKLHIDDSMDEDDSHWMDDPESSGEMMSGDHDEDEDMQITSSNEEDEDEDDEDSDGNDHSGMPTGGHGGMPDLGEAGLHLDPETAAAIFGGGFGSLGSIMSGLSNRLKRLRTQLKSPSATKRLAALRECSELLLVSNEDTLGPSFSISGFATEFIAILNGKPNIDHDTDDGDDPRRDSGELDEDAQLAAALAMSTGGGMGDGVGNEEEMECQLVACRCLAHLMEALPGTGHLLVDLGAVPALCSKLNEISYIELAEQTLSTMEKISSDYPAAIVREGGLGALLNYLPFFSTTVQRTAVTAAANCCKNISKEYYTQIRDVFPILRETLTQADQRLVEQATLAVVRTLESYRHSAENLEGLLTLDTVVAVNALLMPSGGSPLLSSPTFTHLLRALTSSARRSAKVTIAFLEAGVTNTLYQILTGVLPSSHEGDEQGQGVDGQGLAGGVADMAVLQNLAHRPKEQVEESLALICELLPPTPPTGVFDPRGYTEKALGKIKKGKKPPATSDKPRRSTRLGETPTTPASGGASTPIGTTVGTSGSAGGADTTSASNSIREAALRARQEAEQQLTQRIDLLASQPALVGRFIRLLVPVLVDVYAASVSPRVRSKVLLGLIKAISFAPPEDLIETLKLVPMASFLCAIISSRDNPTAVLNALQLVELLATKLPTVYQVSFQREGVVYEIEALAAQETKASVAAKEKATEAAAVKTEPVEPGETASLTTPGPSTSSIRTPQVMPTMPEGLRPLLAGSNVPGSVPSFIFEMEHGSASRPTTPLRSSSSQPVDPEDANIIRARIIVAKKIFEGDGEQKNAATAVLDDLKSLVSRLCVPEASREELRDTLYAVAIKLSGTDQALSSFELLKGGLVDGLLEYVDIEGSVTAHDRRAMLYDVLSDRATSSPTPLTALVKLLHESLGKLEDFEVETAFNGITDTSRSLSSFSRTMKVRLQAEEGSDIPKHVSAMIISIQAIAQFGQLNDYLRPRIASGGNHLSGLSASHLSSMFAAYASGMPIPRGGGPGGSGGSGLGSSSTAASRILSALTASRPGAGGPGGDSGDPTGPGNAASTTSPLSSLFASSAPESSRLAQRAQGAAESTDKPPSDNTRPRRSARLSGHRTGGSGTHSAPAENAQGNLSTSAPEPTILPPMPMDLDFDDEDEYSDEEYAEEVFEEDMEEELARPQEKVVNMNVAPDGSRVEAKTPEGTRIATPNQAAGLGAGSGPGAPKPSGASGTNTPRTASYAGAVKAAGGDWHLEFTLDGHKLALDDTIYGAVHKYHKGPNTAGSGLYASPVLVKFRKVDGPAPSTDNAIDAPSPGSMASHMPEGLDASTPTSKILRLLRVVHNLSMEAGDVSNGKDALAETLFVNNKLTAKLTRQLEEVMIIASNCLPDWAVEITKHFSFLFPFETRYSFLSSTSFGYSRLMSKFIAANQSRSSSLSRRDDMSHLARIQRQKVRISRAQLLESCTKVMELYGMGSWVLEVEYFDEIGTGLGPTLEFYSLASAEFAKRSLGLWRDEDENAPGVHVKHPNGLFPAPMGTGEPPITQAGSRLALFKTLGIFVGRALLDSRIIDVNLNKVFLRLILGKGIKKNIATLKLVDKTLASSLERLQVYLHARKEIEALQLPPSARRNKLAMLTVGGARLSDLSLDFTLPGYSHIELKPGGAHIDVDDHNLEEYLERVLDVILGSGVERQARAFAEGFSMIFPMGDMKIFTPDELGLLFGNADEDWSKETIEHAIKADHGYNLDSRAVHNLIEIMSEYSKDERRQFLQFITGAPKLPIGGFRGLTPPFTVVRKPHEPPFRADDYLPSVMTCAQYLKLPDYSTKEVLAAQLSRAMLDGGGSFHLS